MICTCRAQRAILWGHFFLPTFTWIQEFDSGLQVCIVKVAGVLEPLDHLTAQVYMNFYFYNFQQNKYKLKGNKNSFGWKEFHLRNILYWRILNTS